MTPQSAKEWFTVRRTIIIRVAWTLVIVIAIGLQSCYFAVNEGRAVVVTRLGRPVRELRDAGPYLKFPWPIDEINDIDLRLHLFNTPYTATLTKDKKSVVLLSYLVWRVEKPLLFLQTLGTVENANRKLDGMTIAAKNFHLGQYDLSALVSTNASEIKTEEIEHRIREDVAKKAASQMGISVTEFGFKRVAFPEENTPAVLSHMRAERNAEANRLRAEGEKEAQTIRNEALVRNEEILSEGRKKAGEIRGNGEREAAQIYAQSESRDPRFYRYWRSLEASKKVMSSSRSTIVLRTDQSPFDALGEEKP